MGEQMYVIATMEDALTQPLVTKPELMKRLNKALHTAMVSNVTELITNEDEVIDILLHSTEKEPLAESIRKAKP